MSKWLLSGFVKNEALNNIALSSSNITITLLGERRWRQTGLCHVAAFMGCVLLSCQWNLLPGTASGVVGENARPWRLVQVLVQHALPNLGVSVHQDALYSMAVIGQGKIA